MTEQEFFESEVTKWGFDYIENLINEGCVARYTERGWRWIWPLTAGDPSASITHAERGYSRSS